MVSEFTKHLAPLTVVEDTLQVALAQVWVDMPPTLAGHLEATGKQLENITVSWGPVSGKRGSLRFFFFFGLTWGVTFLVSLPRGSRSLPLERRVENIHLLLLHTRLRTHSGTVASVAAYPFLSGLELRL